MAKLDVLIPTYNRKEFLPQAIESLLGQSYQDFHILVYDDGSDDGTETVIPHDSRITFVRSERNRGVGYARNVLLNMIKSPLACWQDSDDISHPQRIEKQIKLMSQCEFDMIFTDLYFFRHPDHHTHTRTIRKIDVSKFDSYEVIVDNINFPTGMFRNHVKQTSFNEDLRDGGEDVDWLVRLAADGLRFGQVKEALYFLRRHPGRLTHLRASSQQRA